MSENVRESLKDACARFEYFSVALDESTHLKDTAQIAVFVREVKPSQNIVELDKLIPVKCTTTGEDIFKTLQTVIADEKHFFKTYWSYYKSRPVMVGQKMGVISLLERWMKHLGISHKKKFR